MRPLICRSWSGPESLPSPSSSQAPLKAFEQAGVTVSELKDDLGPAEFREPYTLRLLREAFDLPQLKRAGLSAQSFERSGFTHGL